MKKPKLCILSGGFDPLHTGHIKMFEHARMIADKVIVCVNSDEWLIKKKGVPLLNIEERIKIIESIKYVDEAITFDDDEYGSACLGIKKVVEKYQDKYEYIFGNGGDRNINTTPSHEQILAESLGVKMMYGIGGENKTNSSSEIIKKYIDGVQQLEKRTWGTFRVIHNNEGYKVKSLIVEPGKKLSLQSHKYRSEHWIVVKGEAKTTVEIDNNRIEKIIKKNEYIYVPTGSIHQLENNGNTLLEVIEIQMGKYLKEDDIIYH